MTLKVCVELRWRGNHFAAGWQFRALALPLIWLPPSSPSERGEGRCVCDFAKLPTLQEGPRRRDCFFLPVYGGEAWSAQRIKSQLLGFSNNERPAGQ
ncbi:MULTISPECIES: hypothetical protein [Mesorhizobium]|uniref:hypothetical protein n=1 Tax=Mesorhizobium TaxID=68287 RepID=UPI001012F6D1|nr:MULTISPECIES: hypothetical protein [Mesorhizobium]